MAKVMVFVKKGKASGLTTFSRHFSRFKNCLNGGSDWERQRI